MEYENVFYVQVRGVRRPWWTIQTFERLHTMHKVKHRFLGFVWHKTQLDYVETAQETADRAITFAIELSSSGLYDQSDVRIVNYGEIMESHVYREVIWQDGKCV